MYIMAGSDLGPGSYMLGVSLWAIDAVANNRGLPRKIVNLAPQHSTTIAYCNLTVNDWFLGRNSTKTPLNGVLDS